MDAITGRNWTAWVKKTLRPYFAKKKALFNHNIERMESRW